jgi:hypothetical protein
MIIGLPSANRVIEIAAPISALVIDDDSAAKMKARFAGSRPPDYVGVGWLGAHSTNSIALSASAFYQARIAKPSKAPNPFFGYADPVIPTDPEDFPSVRPIGRHAEADGSTPPAPRSRPDGPGR